MIIGGNALEVDFPCVNWRKHGLRFEKPQIRVFRRPPRQIVSHWTGGEEMGGGFRDAARVFRVLKNRAKKHGGLSVHFFEDTEGVVWQFADPLTDRCRHASRVNNWSIGWEKQSRGYWTKAYRGHRPIVHQSLKSRMRKIIEFPDVMMESWVKGCEVLAEEIGIERQIPSGPNGILDQYMSRNRQRTFKGGIAHFHCGKKLDAGLQPLQALLDNGWELA